MVIAESAVKPPVQEQLKSSTQPKVGVWELLTKWQWGFQDPNIPLPVPVVDGQPPEVCTAVTQEHLDILARDGVVLVKGVLNKPWIDYLRAISDWQIEHPHILALPGVISNLYDYIQRTTWRTNKGFAEFMFYSPVASCLSQIAKCGWFPEGDKLGYHEIRISTDLLMVNPNKGFKWHQDEQNGPLTAGRGVDTRLDALRWWCTMDDAELDVGTPVYLAKSHENDFMDKDVVFVSDSLISKYEAIEFRPQAGDMLIWHPKTIHMVQGPKGGWGDRKRRVLGGTAAVGECTYEEDMEHALGKHGLRQGMPLRSPFFPVIYPRSDDAEREAILSGQVGRSGDGYGRMYRTMGWYLQGLLFKTSIETIQERNKDVKTKTGGKTAAAAAAAKE